MIGLRSKGEGLAGILVAGSVATIVPDNSAGLGRRRLRQDHGPHRLGCQGSGERGRRDDGPSRLQWGRRPISSRSAARRAPSELYRQAAALGWCMPPSVSQLCDCSQPRLPGRRKSWTATSNSVTLLSYFSSGRGCGGRVWGLPWSARKHHAGRSVGGPGGETM